MSCCCTCTTQLLHAGYCFALQKVTDFNEICEEIERETERVTGNNKVG